MATIPYEFYEEDSWDLWERTIVGHANRMIVEDIDAYLPSPEEIRQRCFDMDWMKFCGFSDDLVWSVMHHDQPGIALVRKLEAIHGVKLTEKKLEPFISKRKDG